MTCRRCGTPGQWVHHSHTARQTLCYRCVVEHLPAVPVETLDEWDGRPQPVEPAKPVAVVPAPIPFYDPGEVVAFFNNGPEGHAAIVADLMGWDIKEAA